MINKNTFLVFLIFFAIISRFIPHPPNFTPIGAVALLSSKGFNNYWIGFFLPLISLIISDLFLGIHSLIPFVYLAFSLISFLGFYVKKINFFVILFSSTIFFIISNFGVWLLNYPKSIDGFISCYVLAIPFFLNTIIGDLIYGTILIYTFYSLQKRNIISI